MRRIISPQFFPGHHLVGLPAPIGKMRNFPPGPLRIPPGQNTPSRLSPFHRPTADPSQRGRYLCPSPKINRAPNPGRG